MMQMPERKKYMVQKVDGNVMRLIREYYLYHGDRNVRYAGTIHTPQGGKLYLVRFDNAGGFHYSGIVMIGTGYRGDYATELWSCPRSKENDMIAYVMEQNKAYQDFHGGDEDAAD